MNNTNLEAHESLEIIHKMINNAKSRLADDGFLLIFWGWLVTIASLIHYTTIKLDLNIGHWFWPVLMPLGGIFSAIYGYRQGKKKLVKSYVDTYLSYLWTAFGIGLVIILVFMPAHGIKPTYFSLMLLYGIATFISGGILSFKPLVFGSLVAFASAVASVFFNETEQLLIIAVALTGSYIIPGHLLRSKYRSQNV